MSTDINTSDINYPLQILKSLAITSKMVLEAGIAGEDNLTRTNIDKMRQLRSDLNSIGKNYLEKFDAASFEVKKVVQDYINSINQSEQFIDAWNHRMDSLLTLEQRLVNQEGRETIVDQIIPSTWNWNEDIAIFRNDINQALIETLINRGQKRIIILCLEKILKAENSWNCTYIQDQLDSTIYFQQIKTEEMPGRAATFIFNNSNEDSTSASRDLKYEEISEAFFAAWRRRIVNSRTINHFGQRWLSQGLENLPYIAEHNSLSALEDLFKNVPMVLISPGPSLDKNIGQLKQLIGKALLVATQPAAKALSVAGIFPNIIILADPSDLTYQLEDVQMDKVDALLLGVSCHPDLYKKYSGKILTFNVNGGIDNWISDIFSDTVPRISSGGSVSTTALHIGMYLKCDPIILVGQDLSMSNGKIYATNAADGAISVNFKDDDKSLVYRNISENYIKSINNKQWAEVSFSSKVELLPGYYGGFVKTKSDYALFHSEFETAAVNNKLKATPTVLLNCTEGGAFIKGFEHIALKEAITLVDNSHNSKLVSGAIIRERLIQTDTLARKKILAEKLEQIKKSFDKSHKLALECKKSALKVRKSLQPKSALAAKETELVKAVHDSLFISIARQADINYAIKIGGNATDLKSSLDASGILYDLIIESTTFLHPFLRTSLNILNRPEV